MEIPRQLSLFKLPQQADPSVVLVAYEVRDRTDSPAEPIDLVPPAQAPLPVLASLRKPYYLKGKQIDIKSVRILPFFI